MGFSATCPLPGLVIKPLNAKALDCAHCRRRLCRQTTTTHSQCEVNAESPWNFKRFSETPGRVCNEFMTNAKWIISAKHPRPQLRDLVVQGRRGEHERGRRRNGPSTVEGHEKHSCHDTCSSFVHLTIMI